MPLLVLVSLSVNVLVLVPVLVGLALDATWVQLAYGPRQPGRQILLAIYAAILALSAALFFWGDARVALGLFLVQIVYKLLSPLTVGTLKNPVVVSNLVIALLHSVTVFSLLRS